MLIASFSTFMGQPLLIIFFELIGASLVAFGLFSYIKNLNIRQQLQAKDATIETNRQTIEAFEDRFNSLDIKIKDLEEKLKEAESRNKTLTAELRDWEVRYKSLENFAAPQLGEKLLDMFKHQEKVLDKIVTLLDGIEKRMDAIESKASGK